MNQHLKDKLSAVIPEFELDAKLELIAEINELKREKNAIILGHNYMEPAVFHGVADVTGDSLELCFKANEAKEDTIVFCGVEFMAETAKILNPSKRVLLPAKKAGCSLASSITADDVRRLKAMYPGVPVVTYINTYADVKAETDICCTSGNAEKIVASLDSDQVIFIPDEYLAKNVAKATGKHIIFPTLEQKSSSSQIEGFEKVFIGWPGKCEVHDLFTTADINAVREQYPDVKVLAHPECPPDVVDAADFSGSTSAMIRYVKEHEQKQYLLLTECSMADNIIASNPKSELLRLCSHRCPHMAQITLEDTKRCLELGQFEINVDKDLAIKAKASIDAMLQLSL
jgi:quinolinate synthase